MRWAHVLCGLLLLSFASLSFGDINPNFVPRPPKQMGNLMVLSCRNINEMSVRMLALDSRGNPFSIRVSNFQCEHIPGWSEWSQDLDEERKEDPFKARLR